MQRTVIGLVPFQQTEYGYGKCSDTYDDFRRSLGLWLASVLRLNFRIELLLEFQLGVG